MSGVGNAIFGSLFHTFFVILFCYFKPADRKIDLSTNKKSWILRLTCILQMDAVVVLSMQRHNAK
jgi:hypothetical protein